MISKMNFKTAKTIGFASVIMLSFASCNTTKTNSDSVKNDVSETHNAKTSLDYNGIYQGTLPCADCQGIKTTITINDDNTYLLKQDYLGKNTSIEEKGNYAWDKNNNQFTLQPSDAKGQSLKFFVGENTLIALDTTGNKITGALADQYILSKNNVALSNKKWTITELYGKPYQAESTMKKEGYIQFDDNTNGFSASAGCNQMNGEFSIKPNDKLELGKIMSTMMACPDMSAEVSLGKALEATKSFQINQDELNLLEKDQTVIAKFKTSAK